MSGTHLGDSTRVPIGSSVFRLSTYCTGWWPCQQADGDSDDEQVTDRSGNDAHATIGLLTAAEAWDTQGYLHTLNDGQHNGRIPAAKCPHRFSTMSLIVELTAQVSKEGSTEAIFGNRDANYGYALTCTTAGALQWVFTADGSTTFGSATSTTPYASAELHHVVGTYDLLTGELGIYVDGTNRISNPSLTPQATIIASDGMSPSDTVIGGRGVTAASGAIAGLFQHVRTYSLPGRGLPENIDDIVKRMYAFRTIPLSAVELGR